MTAIFFGSASTLADTSELQREAFNQAFADHGLDWSWDLESYRSKLASSGGRDRIAAQAKERGEDVDADAVHQTKSEVFQSRLREGVPAREGVVETIRDARERGIKVGLVTTTSAENVAALIEGVQGVTADDFHIITDSSHVDQPKPDGAVYTFAAEQVGEQVGDCVAIEDNLGGVEAAKAAGLRIVAFPNQNTAGHDFGAADALVDSLDVDSVVAPA